jgi:hypothetical protein
VSVLGSGGATFPALLSSGAIASGSIGFFNPAAGPVVSGNVGHTQPSLLCCIHCKKGPITDSSYVLIRRFKNRRTEFITVCEACADYNAETNRFEGRLRGLIEASPFEQDVALGILADWMYDKEKIGAEAYVRSLIDDESVASADLENRNDGPAAV